MSLRLRGPAWSISERLQLPRGLLGMVRQTEHLEEGLGLFPVPPGLIPVARIAEEDA